MRVGVWVGVWVGGLVANPLFLVHWWYGSVAGHVCTYYHGGAFSFLPLYRPVPLTTFFCPLVLKRTTSINSTCASYNKYHTDRRKMPN